MNALECKYILVYWYVNFDKTAITIVKLWSIQQQNYSLYVQSIQPELWSKFLCRCEKLLLRNILLLVVSDPKIEFLEVALIVDSLHDIYSRRIVSVTICKDYFAYSITHVHI